MTKVVKAFGRSVIKKLSKYTNIKRHSTGKPPKKYIKRTLSAAIIDNFRAPLMEDFNIKHQAEAHKTQEVVRVS